MGITVSYPQPSMVVLSNFPIVWYFYCTVPVPYPGTFPFFSQSTVVCCLLKDIWIHRDSQLREYPFSIERLVIGLVLTLVYSVIMDYVVASLVTYFLEFVYTYLLGQSTTYYLYGGFLPRRASTRNQRCWGQCLQPTKYSYGSGDAAQPSSRRPDPLSLCFGRVTKTGFF